MGKWNLGTWILSLLNLPVIWHPGQWLNLILTRCEAKGPTVFCTQTHFPNTSPVRGLAPWPNKPFLQIPILSPESFLSGLSEDTFLHKDSFLPARFIPSFLQACIASSGFSRLLSLYFSWDFIKKMKIFIDRLHQGKRIVDHMCSSARVGFPWPELSSTLGSACSPATPSSGKRVTVIHKWCPLAGLKQAPSPRMASSGLRTHSLIQ